MSPGELQDYASDLPGVVQLHPRPKMINSQITEPLLPIVTWAPPISTEKIYVVFLRLASLVTQSNILIARSKQSRLRGVIN